MNNYPWPDMTEEEIIGSGSYGTVYKVMYNGKACALKRIHIPASPREFDALLLKLGSPEKVRKFCREAAEDLMGEIKILERFQGHPNIVTIIDSAIKDTESGSEIFLLMEYLQPFSEYEITHVMEESDVIKMGTDLCSALEAIEKEGILHRDLKPDNILAAPEGNFKLCDFGVARNLERTVSDLSLKGTFSFMAPESYHGKPYDKRADLYSLGLILYRAVNNGRLPFMSQDMSMVSFKDKKESLNRRMNGEAFPLPENAGEAFSDVLLKACAYYPEKRYACAADMKKALCKLQKAGSNDHSNSGNSSGHSNAGNGSDHSNASNRDTKGSNRRKNKRSHTMRREQKATISELPVSLYSLLLFW